MTNLSLKLLLITCILTSAACSFSHNDKKALFQRIGSSVVKVQVVGKRSMGTGFAVESKALGLGFLTASHVCAEETGSVNLTQGKKAWVGEIKKLEIKSDLCFIAAKTELNPLSLAVRETVNDHVFIVGHPFGYPLTLTEGMLLDHYGPDPRSFRNTSESACTSAGGVYVDLSSNLFAMMSGVFSECHVNVIQVRTTAKAYPGNSGSPVVNARGLVIGLVSSTDATSFDGFLVSLEDVREFLGLKNAKKD